jgi:hypothetical protein
VACGWRSVYNFEVESAHTYFVADGIGHDSFIWAHNSCDENGDFLGPLAGRFLPFKGVKVQKKNFTVRTTEENAALRSAFDAANGPKAQFVKSMANDPAVVAKLKQAGVSQSAINDMKNGYVPTGFNVHHKDPLKLGGDNSQSNLMLLQNGELRQVNYHSAVTNYQNSLTNKLNPGESFETTWPVFNGVIYP